MDLYSEEEARYWLDANGARRMPVHEALCGVDAFLYLLPRNIMSIMRDVEKPFTVLRAQKPVVSVDDLEYYLDSAVYGNAYVLSPELLYPYCAHGKPLGGGYKLQKIHANLYYPDDGLFPLCGFEQNNKSMD